MFNNDIRNLLPASALRIASCALLSMLSTLGMAQGTIEGTPLYRVNAGGISLPAPPLDWELDKEGTPSLYVNSGESNNTTGWDGGWTGTNLTGAPDLIFTTDRWDGPWNDEMKWDFPVENGTYQVNLYFCEYKPEYSLAGTRFFDVSLEGALVLDDYDIILDAGYNTAVKKSFVLTVLDGNIDIDFDRVVGGENPKVNGIEILTASGNNPPVITQVPDQETQQGTAVSLTANATDEDGDGLTFSATNLPSGLQLNAASGLISGTLTAAGGSYAVSIIATDDGTPNKSDTTTFNWLVTVPNQPPGLQNPGNQSHETEKTISLAVSAPDPEGDNVLFGASGLPAGLSINPSTGLISGTITAAPATFPVTLTATDDGEPVEASQVSFSWEVRPIQNDPPILLAIGDQAQVAGSSVSLQVNASDPEGDNLAFDAQGLPAGLTINPQTGLISGTLAAAVGTYPVTVSVVDDGVPMLEAVETFDWTIQPPNQAPVLVSLLDQLHPEGAVVSLMVSASDPDGDALTFGATGLPAGLGINAATGEISGTITAAAGTYPVIVTATDDGPGTLMDQIAFSWVIAPPAQAGATLFRINAGGDAIPTPSTPWAGDTQGAPSANLDPANNQTTGWHGGFAVADGINNTSAPDSLFGQYRLDASWSADPGIEYNFSVENGTYEVRLFFAEYQNAAVGARVFDVLLEGALVLDNYDIVAVDGFNQAVEKIFQVEVADGVLTVVLDRIPGSGYPLLSGLQVAAVGNANTPPTLAAVPDQAHHQGEAVSLQLVANEVDGDALSFSASGLPIGLAINAATGEISGTIDEQAPLGDYDVQVQVIDDGTPAAKDVQAFTWTVTVPPNLPPVFVDIPNQANEQGEEGSLSVQATDPEGDRFTFDAQGLPAGLSIHPSTGLISGTITAAPAVYSVSLTATDEGTPTAVGTTSFSWTVTLPNQAPVIDPIAELTHEEGETVAFTPSASDYEQGTLNWAAQGLPAGLGINAATGEISGTITATAATYPVTLMVEDDGEPALGDTLNFDWTIVVPPPNQAPVLAAMPDQEHYTGEQVSLLVAATDADGDKLSFEALNLPTGLAINATTGEISGTITAAPQVFEVEVIVTDDGLPLVEDDTVSFQWTVTAPPPNLPPSISPVADVEVLDGHEVSVAISATDPDGDNIVLVASGLPSGVSLSQNAGSGSLQGTVVPPSAGTYEVQLIATDDGSPNEADTLTFQLTVLPNTAPFFAGVLDQLSEEGAVVGLQLVANDVNPEDALTFAATGLPAGLTLNASTGLISGALTAPVGMYPVTVSVSDAANTVTQTFNWVVNAPPVAGDVLFRINAGGIAVPATPAWALDKEGTPSPYANSDQSNSTTGWDFGWTGLNETGAPDTIFATDRWDGPWGGEMSWDFPVENGAYEVNLYFAEYKPEYNAVGVRFFDVLLEDELVLDDYDITGTEGFNVAAKKTFTVNVLDGNIDIDFLRVAGGENPKVNGIQIAAIGSSNAPPAVQPLADQETQQTLAVSLQVTASDPDGDALQFGAIGLPQGLAINPTAGLISGTLTAEPGTYDVSVQVLDDGTPVSDSVISFSWTVLPPPNTAPVLASIEDQTSFEGDAISLSLIGSDADGDQLTYEATGLPAGLQVGATTGLISGTLTAPEGTYPVTITLTDDGPGNLSTTQSFTWTVYEVNIAPILSAISDQNDLEGAAVSLQLNATDANNDNLQFAASGLPAGLAIDMSTGEISGTITAPYDTYAVTITVSDDGVPSLNDVQNFDWIVSEPPNIAPVITAISDQTDEQGEQVSLPVEASDPDGDNLSFAALGLPAGLQLQAGTAAITGILTADVGTYEVEIIATDDGTPSMAADTFSFTWNVIAPVNDPPVLEVIADQVNTEGDAVSLVLSAVDPEADNLTFSETGLPAGLNLNASTGLISGTLAAPADTLQVTVSVMDDGSPQLSDQQTFTWIILPPNQAPVITALGDQQHFQGEEVLLQVVATDPEGDGITFGAQGLPEGLSLNFASGYISGTITAGAGSYPVTLTATDDGAPSEQGTYAFTWTVELPPNEAPSLSAIPDRNDESGSEITQTVSASDPDGDALTFSAEGLPDGVGIDPATGTISGTLLAFAGTYEVRVTVTDDGTPNLKDEVTFSWTVTPYVNEQPVLAEVPDQSSRIGDPISLYVSASDPDGDNLFFNGVNLPPSLDIDPLTGEMRGVMVGPEGTYQVQVVVWDDGTPALSDTVAFNWLVEPAPLPISGDPLYRVNAGGMEIFHMPLNWLSDKQDNPIPYVAPGNNQTTGWDYGFTGTNLSGAPDTLFGTLRKDAPWSGNNSFGYDFPLNNGFYEVNLYFAETNGAAPGSRIMDVVVDGTIVLDNYDIAATEGENVAVKKTFLVEVADGNLDVDLITVGGTETATINGIEIRASGNNPPLFAMSNQVHEEFEEVSVTVNASDPEGHGLSYQATGLPDGLSINAQTGVISGTIVADTGDYEVIITVTDNGQPNEATSRAFTWTVLPTPQPNHPPVVTMNDQAHEEGLTISVQILAADPDGDVLSYSATGLPAGLSLNVNTGLISGTITAPANTYPVSITVLDDGQPNLNTVRAIDWVIVVPPPNHPPVIAPIADQSFMIGSTVSIPVAATDQDGDNLSFAATGLPTGITMDPATGAMSGTITGAPGLYSVTVTVTDDGEPQMDDVDVFNWTVEESQVEACVSVLEYQSDILFASNFEEGSTKILNLAPNGEKIVRVTFDVRDIMYPDFALDDGTALGGNMGTPGYKVPTQDPGSSPVGYPQGSHIYEHPHLPFPILDPSIEVGYQGFTLNFDPSKDGGFEPGEEFHFSWDTDPTNISFVTTNNGPGGGGKTNGLDLSGTKVTIEWDNGTVITKELWYASGSVCGSQAYFNNTFIERPTIDILDLPQDSMRVDGVNHTVRVTGEPGRQVSLLVGEAGNYYTGAGIPEGGYDPDYFETNNIISFQEITNYSVGPEGYVDIPITLHRTDLDSYNLELPEELTNYWIIRAALKDDAACTAPPCNAACSSPVSNKLVLLYDPSLGNLNPFIVPIADQSSQQGLDINMPIEAHDPEAGTLTCTATGLPGGLSMDPQTGVISGQINAPIGTYQVTVTVTDDGLPAMDTTRSFAWTVVATTNPNPVLAAIEDQESEEGETVSLSLSATDPNGDALTYSATGLPEGLTLNPLSGVIEGVAAATPGTYAVTVTVTDDGEPAKTDTEAFTWTIIEATNKAPVLAAVADQSHPQTSEVLLQLSATDPDGDTLSYAASGLPEGLVLNPNTGEISGTLTAAEGIYSVQVIATDDGEPPLSDTLTFNWTVTAALNQPPVLAAVADQQHEVGAEVSLAIEALDPDGDGLIFSITNLPEGLSLNPATGLITGTITGVQGIYPVEVIVTDDGTPPLSDTLKFDWTVTAPPNQAPTLAPIADQTHVQQDEVNLDVVSATDPEGDAISYTATNMPSGLSMTAGTGIITGTITAEPGVYVVAVIASDNGIPIASDTLTFSWTVEALPNQAPVLAALPNQTHTQGDAVSVQVVASDPENDVLLFNAIGLPPGLGIDGLTGEIQGVLSAAPGDYEVSIMVQDNGVPSEGDTLYLTWTIEAAVNQAPVLEAVADQSDHVGETLSLPVNGSDPDGDALTYSATGLPAGLQIDSQAGLISGTITASAANYTVTITLTDDGDPVEQASITFLWVITSPPSNYPPEITAIPDQYHVVGDVVSLQVEATDPENHTLFYNISGLPSGLSANPITGLISGTLTAAAGTYGVTVNVLDYGTPSASSSIIFTWHVEAPAERTAAPGAMVPALTVYPNPVEDAFTLVLPDAVSGRYELILTNLSGKVIRHMQASGRDVPRPRVPMADLPEGVYLLRVRAEGHAFRSIRIMKK